MDEKTVTQVPDGTQEARELHLRPDLFFAVKPQGQLSLEAQTWGHWREFALSSKERLALASFLLGESKECAAKECSYYQHYLAYGPAELTHDGYHAAEGKCGEAQRACIDHAKSPCQSCELGRCSTSRELDRIATHWEVQVRA